MKTKEYINYINPIVPLDYSDPDVIRVEQDGISHYYYAASTFMDVPGAVVLHSFDLLNWEIGGYAFENPGEFFEHYASERMDWYEFGIYAPTIRQHNGLFYVYSPIYPDGGICVSMAEKVSGPWKTQFVVDKNGLPLSFPKCRLTDVCPFWDDDGKAYLILSNLESQNLGITWKSESESVAGSSAQLFRMSVDGTMLLDADASSREKFAHSGVCVRNIFCTEGNKIYKKDGWYYFLNVCFLGNSPCGKGMYIRRSRCIYGDGGPIEESDKFWHAGKYEMKYLGGMDEIPTQGAFFSTGDGEWYFMGQKPDDSAGGRMGYLIPVCWKKDEFPVLCMDHPLRLPLESCEIQQITEDIVGSDNFDTECLKKFWNWNHCPDENYYEMTGDALRIYAQPRIPCGVDGRVIWGVRNILFQKYIHAEQVDFEVYMNMAGMKDGQEAGIVHFNGGDEFTAFYVRMEGERKCLCLDWTDRNSKENRMPYHSEEMKDVFVLNPDHEMPGGVDRRCVPVEINGECIWLKSVIREQNGGIHEQGEFLYSMDGIVYQSMGMAQIPDSGRFRGDRIGLYTCNDSGCKGYIEFKYVNYNYQKN